MLSKVLADLASESHEVGKDSFDLVLARAEAEEEDKVVRLLASEIRALSIELLAPSRARPLDEAIATKVNGPKQRLRIAGAAGGLGLALALLAVALWELLSRRVKSADEVACGLGVRLVGTLPAVSRPRARPAGAAEQPGGGQPPDALHRLGRFVPDHAAARGAGPTPSASSWSPSAVSGEGQDGRWPATWPSAWPGPGPTRCSSMATSRNPDGPPHLRPQPRPRPERVAPRRDRPGRRRCGRPPGAGRGS